MGVIKKNGGEKIIGVKKKLGVEKNIWASMSSRHTSFFKAC